MKKKLIFIFSCLVCFGFRYLYSNFYEDYIIASGWNLYKTIIVILTFIVIVLYISINVNNTSTHIKLGREKYYSKDKYGSLLRKKNLTNTLSRIILLYPMWCILILLIRILDFSTTGHLIWSIIVLAFWIVVFLLTNIGLASHELKGHISPEHYCEKCFYGEYKINKRISSYSNKEVVESGTSYSSGYFDESSVEISDDKGRLVGTATVKGNYHPGEISTDYRLKNVTYVTYECKNCGHTFEAKY